VVNRILLAPERRGPASTAPDCRFGHHPPARPRGTARGSVPRPERTGRAQPGPGPSGHRISRARNKTSASIPQKRSQSATSQHVVPTSTPAHFRLFDLVKPEFGRFVYRGRNRTVSTTPAIHGV